MQWSRLKGSEIWRKSSPEGKFVLGKMGFEDLFRVVFLEHRVVSGILSIRIYVYKKLPHLNMVHNFMSRNNGGWNVRVTFGGLNLVQLSQDKVGDSSS